MDPDAQIDIKLVVGQEHPAELTNELESAQYVIDVLIRLEVVEIEAGVAHAQQLVPFIQSLLVATRQFKVNT